MNENGMEVKYLRTAADVTEGHLREAERTFDGWFDNDEPIDWEAFIDKFADPHGHGDAGRYDLDEYDNPAVRKIKKHVRRYRNEG